MTKAQLTQIIREELKASKVKKKSLQEIDMNIVGPAAGVILPGVVAAFAAIKGTLKSAKEKLKGQTNPDTGKPYTDKEIKTLALGALVNKMKEYGGD